MAANKFATMLHRNTNKITVVLIYAVLEWTLILLLLLNSLFSHLIIKFTDFFGLKPPCPWCARLDHVFDRSKKNENSLRDLLCEAHSREISRLGFCSNHRKLVESRGMCEDCLSSDFEGKRESGILRENGTVGDDKVGEIIGELSLKNCSCCGGVRLLDSCNREDLCNETSSWDVLECDLKQHLMVNHHVEEGCDGSDKKISDFSGNLCDKSVQVCVEEQSSPQHLEFFLDYTGHKLVPIEIVDFITDDKNSDKIEDCKVDEDQELEEADSDVEVEDKSSDKIEDSKEDSMLLENGFLDIDINVMPEDSIMDFIEIEEDESSLVFHHNLIMTEEFQKIVDSSLARFSPGDDVHEDREHEADVSIGTEIPDIDISDDVHNQEPLQQSEGFVLDDASTSSYNAYESDSHGAAQDEEQGEELESVTAQETDETTKNEPSELNEITEEDKLPDSPTSMDSHRKLLLLEKRDSGLELESQDGSITSDYENCDGVITIERLKSVIRSERKVLQELYAELEEERSASAVAANQTMAMINRLQEEKAAMQMEALQYQRMMEEQSEYDQEAVQLLNELVVKREKEKQELERELEVCKKRILDYETKERLKAVRSSKDGSCRSGFSSGSYSNAEDSDGLSVDLETKEEEGYLGNRVFDRNDQNTPIEAVLDLEESLADFEDERLSILEQLKVLEEKLFTLDDETEHHFEDVRTIDALEQENGDCINGHAHNEHDYPNGKHNQIRKIANQNGKSLLPLFDAIDHDENGDPIAENGNGFHDYNGVHDNHESKLEKEDRKLAIEEEVDHLYEILQALEADREFFKHCISSLKKGDKGMDLLKEILQHLRDLRNVELRVRNSNDNNVI